MQKRTPSTSSLRPSSSALPPPLTPLPLGFYIAHNHLCNDVQALHDAGSLDGVILGNRAAVTRDFTRSFGETRPLDAWFEGEQGRSVTKAT